MFSFAEITEDSVSCPEPSPSNAVPGLPCTAPWSHGKSHHVLDHAWSFQLPRVMENAPRNPLDFVPGNS